MGREDIEIVAPAVDILRAEGVDARGPLPPDTMFHDAARAKYDVAICMYHDQALIPIKTLAFWTGVNVTLGLSIVRAIALRMGAHVGLGPRPDGLGGCRFLMTRPHGSE